VQGIPTDVKERALRRLVRGSRDVGAAFWRDITEPGLEGRAFRTVITDGETFEVVDWIDSEAPLFDLLSWPVEGAVEERVCRICPEGARLAMLRAFGLWFDEGRIPIRLGARAVPVGEPGMPESAPKAA
jgi:hypothetical protein